MNETSIRIAQIVALLMMLVLVGRGLAARRMPASRWLRLVLLWVAIFIGVTALVLALGIVRS